MTLSALEATRDIVIIIWGILGILAFVFLILLIYTLWRGVRGLLGDVRVVMNEDMRPIIATSRESINNVTGTTRFLSDTIVQPIIRLYGIINGFRRGLSVFLGLTRRRKKA